MPECATDRVPLSSIAPTWMVCHRTADPLAEPSLMKGDPKRIALCAVLAAGIFALDLTAPAALTVPLLYTVLVGLCLRLSRPRAVLAAAGAASVLTLVAFILRSGADPALAPAANRALVLAALWAAAIFGHRAILWRNTLADARQAAVCATAEKTRFLSAAGHDLRHPIQAGVLFHDLLKRRLRGSQNEELVNGLGQSLDQMQAMVDALLEISRLDAGRAQPRRVPVAIPDLFTRLNAEFAAKADAAGLTLTLVPCRATVRSDPDLLLRLLGCLLANAVAFTERGRILVGCRREGRHVRIQVWDTGIGIPSDQLTAIFDEFHQLRMINRDSGKGFGLGLALVRRLGRALDHGIGVRSAVGRGSVFEVKAPLAD